MNTTPSASWLREFSERMDAFEAASPENGISVSIKLRVDSGCFCRSCCREAHRIIQDYIHLHPEVARSGHMVEHESGPEIITYLNVAAGVSSLAAGVVALIVAIVQARSAGAKAGDRSGAPFKLIVRRIDDVRGYKEEVVAEISSAKEVDLERVIRQLTSATDKIRDDAKPKAPRRKKKKG